MDGPIAADLDPRLPAGAPLFAEGSVNAAFHRDMQPRKGETVVQKDNVSVFAGASAAALDKVLKDAAIDTLIVTGLQTHACVAGAARDAAAAPRGYRVIVAVNGICCGGGLELALSGDLILCSTNATFALPEIRSGTVADAASIKLPKRIPYHVAMDLLLTGRWFDAEEAHRWGIVKEICAPEDLLAKAWDLARLLESGPPLVYAAIKDLEHQEFMTVISPWEREHLLLNV